MYGLTSVIEIIRYAHTFTPTIPLTVIPFKVLAWFFIDFLLKCLISDSNGYLFKFNYKKRFLERTRKTEMDHGWGCVLFCPKKVPRSQRSGTNGGSWLHVAKLFYLGRKWMEGHRISEVFSHSKSPFASGKVLQILYTMCLED